MTRYPLFAIPLLMLGAGCVKEQDAPSQAKAAVKPQRPPSQPGAANKAKASPPPRLPELTPPEPTPAARVVHLFFTSNVDGEFEPCG
jgi:hypothetical protein